MKSDINAIGTYNHCSILSYKLGSNAEIFLSDSPFDVLIAKGVKKKTGTNLWFWISRRRIA